MRANTIEDFFAKVDRSGGVDDCWLWTGAVGGNGYGQVNIKMKKWMPHRLAFTVLRGPIPQGHYVCHRCDTPLCCNPRHLFTGTVQDNTADRDTKGRNRGFTHPAKHGTQAGYVRHVRQRSGEWSMPPCDPCREAQAIYMRAYRAGTKPTASPEEPNEAPAGRLNADPPALSTKRALSDTSLSDGLAAIGNGHVGPDITSPRGGA